MDLTGLWIGRYEPSQGGRPVPFEVELLHRDGALSGLMIEQDGQAEEVRSRLEGGWRGSRVTFRKCWLDVDPGDDAVHTGLVCTDGKRITGRWWFPLTGEAKGTFSMARRPNPSGRIRSRLLRVGG